MNDNDSPALPETGSGERTRVGLGFFRDPYIWCAFGAGLIVWLIMWLLGIPVTGAHRLTAVTLVLSVLVYPILEELVFRGFLQEWLLTRPQLKRSIAGLTGANLVTSVLFAALHLLSQTPVWAGLILFPSLVFGWLRDRYQSVLPGMLVHMFYNAGLLSLFG